MFRLIRVVAEFLLEGPATVLATGLLQLALLAA
jgi:hypothetical protein